jgi:hypothetical protein
LEDAEGTSNVFESENMPNPSNPTGKPKSYRTPRREVWWLDLGAKNQNLESIKRRFEDRLDSFLSSSSSSNSLLRHIASPMDNKLRRNLHQCPGYLREEITLASDVSKSVIVSHAFPSQSEVCSICGQLVQYKCTERSIVDDSHHLPRLQTSGLLSPHSFGPPSPYRNSTHRQSSHDVHDLVNTSTSLSSSPVSRTYGHLSNLPETTVSSSSQLLTNHVLNHPIRRPRTHTKVFQSSKDLAAYYGVPEILPPAPRTLTHHQAKSHIIDFHTLSSNYLSMLSQNPSENTNMTDSVAPLPTSVTAEEMSAPVIPDKDVDLAKLLPAILGTESSLDLSIAVSYGTSSI